MATFLLVHGTFAKRTAWIKTGSPLRQMLTENMEKKGDTASFVSINWSGKNRVRDRLIAAERISEAVTDAKSKKPTERIYIVGHSHGGSAICYFTKKYPELSRCIDGCIFIATPFYSINKNRSVFWLFLLAAIFSFMFLVPLLFNTAITFYHFVNYPEFKTDFSFDHFKYVDDFVALSVSYTMYTSFASVFLLSVILGYNWKKLFVYTRFATSKISFDELETCNMPAGNYLFIRGSGDEAAYSLSFLQILVAVNRRIYTYAGMYIRLSYEYFNRRKLFSAIFALYVLFSLGLFVFNTSLTVSTWFIYTQVITDGFDITFSMVFRILLYSGIILDGEPIQTIIDAVFGDATSVESADLLTASAGLALQLVLLATYVLFLVVFFTLIISLAGWFFAGVSFWLMGATRFLNSLFLEVSIEPVPYGARELLHVQWPSGEGSSSWQLNHSMICSNQQTLQGISDWISSTSSSRPPTSRSSATR